MKTLNMCLALILLGVAAPQETMNTEVLREIAAPGYSKGVSAPFCGMLGGRLIVSGGANFPDKGLLEGGAKKYYDQVWALSKGGWKRVARLPDSTAYGATYGVGRSLVFAGGNAEGTTTDKVYKLRKSLLGYRLTSLPALPVPVEQAGATAEGATLFLVGGVSPEGSDAVYSCDASKGTWKKVATLPMPLVQPVAVATLGKLYVWGGFNPGTNEVPSEGWCLDLKTGTWSDAPSIPDGGTFVGTSGTKVGKKFYTVGGVNKEIFCKALSNKPEDRIPYLSQEPAAYKFRKEVFCFDLGSETWTVAGESGFAALAGPGVASDGKVLYVAGGELKPGVRSGRIFKIDIR